MFLLFCILKIRLPPIYSDRLIYTLHISVMKYGKYICKSLYQWWQYVSLLGLHYSDVFHHFGSLKLSQYLYIFLQADDELPNNLLQGAAAAAAPSSQDDISNQPSTSQTSSSAIQSVKDLFPDLGVGFIEVSWKYDLGTYIVGAVDIYNISSIFVGCHGKVKIVRWSFSFVNVPTLVKWKSHVMVMLLIVGYH